MNSQLSNLKRQRRKVIPPAIGARLSVSCAFNSTRQATYAMHSISTGVPPEGPSRPWSSARADRRGRSRGRLIHRLKIRDVREEHGTLQDPVERGSCSF